MFLQYRIRLIKQPSAFDAALQRGAATGIDAVRTAWEGRIGLDIVRSAQRNLESGGHIASGGLYQSIAVQRDAETGHMAVVATGRDMLRPMWHYAAPVEFGGIPHRPPLAPLVAWAETKLGADERRAFAIARGLQRKIAAAGTREVRYLRDAIEQIEKNAGRYTSALIREIVLTLTAAPRRG